MEENFLILPYSREMEAYSHEDSVHRCLGQPRTEWPKPGDIPHIPRQVDG